MVTEAERKRFRRHDRARTARDRHVGITVPDVDATAAWLAQVIGATNPLTFGPFSDPSGDFMHQLVDVDPRAVVERIRMVRAGNGPGIELFQYTAPGQDHSFRKNSDRGAHHIAFYVRHIDKAVEYAQAHGAQKRLGPFPVTAGPAAGQTINYFQTPFGTDIELIGSRTAWPTAETTQIRSGTPATTTPQRLSVSKRHPRFGACLFQARPTGG